jgi:hypothetical protein
MVTAWDIERARRVYVASRGTEREDVTRQEFERLVAQAKREQTYRDGRLS